MRTVETQKPIDLLLFCYYKFPFPFSLSPFTVSLTYCVGIMFVFEYNTKNVSNKLVPLLPI